MANTYGYRPPQGHSRANHVVSTIEGWWNTCLEHMSCIWSTLYVVVWYGFVGLSSKYGARFRRESDATCGTIA